MTKMRHLGGDKWLSILKSKVTAKEVCVSLQAVELFVVKTTIGAKWMLSKLSSYVQYSMSLCDITFDSCEWSVNEVYVEFSLHLYDTYVVLYIAQCDEGGNVWSKSSWLFG